MDYTYIDEFEWLGDKVPYEVEGNPYREYEKITAKAAIFYSEEPKLIHLMQLKIQSEDLDFSYAGFYNLNLDICDITLVNGKFCKSTILYSVIPKLWNSTKIFFQRFIQ